MPSFTRLACLLAALLLCVSSTLARDDATKPFSVKTQSFESHGVKILVDVYAPRSEGRHPPILVLHGAGGMLFDGPEMQRVAEALASAGFVAYQVHYFDRTHTWFARQAVLLKLFPTWRETVHDAVEWVGRQQPEAGKIGIFGYSLGAFAAVEETRRNPAIAAVVELAGGFWHGHPEGPTRQPLPPIMLLHGREDQRVPLAKYGEPLLAYLRAHDDPVTVHLYPGEGHIFSPQASAQVRVEAVKFFQRHLSSAGR